MRISIDLSINTWGECSCHEDLSERFAMPMVYRVRVQLSHVIQRNGPTGVPQNIQLTSQHASAPLQK